MITEELKDQARVLKRDLKALKEIQHPLYDYDLYRAAKWLREEAGWFIHIGLVHEPPAYQPIIYEIAGTKRILPIRDSDGRIFKDFTTYEEALEAAVEKTLKYIINPLYEIEQ